MIGLICIVMVVVTAYSAELKVENNSLVSSNEAIQGEIDTLNIKIKSAKGKLGMVYPTDGECVYVTEDDRPSENFAMAIKEQAYN